MQKRKYGKLGFDVSAFGMGCMRLPTIVDSEGKAQVDKEKAFEMIHYAADNGVNYFDTAYGYHGQTSESVLGEALEIGGRRSKVKIATKQPFAAMTTQDDIRRNLENTLKKLRTDHIDVYLIHNIQKGTWDEIKRRKVIEEYEKFKAEGLIGAIAFSYHGELPTFRDIMNYYDFGMCQIQQNLLDVDKEVTEEAIQLAGEKGTALVIMEPLRGGNLASAPTRVKKLYENYPTQRSHVDWAFRHLLNYPEVSCILSGTTTLEQLKDNIRIFSAPDAIPGCLTAEDKALLGKVKASYESVVTIPCTGCNYCMPCPQNVDIPGIFSRFNDATMFESFDPSRRTYMFLTRAGKDATGCVECGLCEAQCPQHIDIINQLKMAHEPLKGWAE